MFGFLGGRFSCYNIVMTSGEYNKCIYVCSSSLRTKDFKEFGQMEFRVNGVKRWNNWTKYRRIKKKNNESELKVSIN